MSRVRHFSFKRAVTLGLLTMAALAHSRPAVTWGLDLEEKIGGDSNVMRLSPSELDRLDGDPSFQATAKGPADLRLDHRVLGDIRYALPDRKMGRLQLNLDAKVVTYLDNTDNNYSTQRWGLDWQLKPGWGADVSWFGMSNFYLRDFTDGDTGEIHGAEFDSNEYRLRIRARGPNLGPVRRPTATLITSFEEAFYNGWFTEYDTETVEIGVRLDGDLPQDLTASLQFYFADTDNVGYRAGANSSNGEDSESGDGSHQENRLQAGLGWSGELMGHDLSLDVDFSWRHREYQSTLGEIEDPVHAGRHDDRYVLSLNKVWRIDEHLSVRPFAEREWRHTGGPWQRLPEFKDFASNRIGLAVRYTIQ